MCPHEHQSGALRLARPGLVEMMICDDCGRVVSEHADGDRSYTPSPTDLNERTKMTVL